MPKFRLEILNYYYRYLGFIYRDICIYSLGELDTPVYDCVRFLTSGGVFRKNENNLTDRRERLKWIRELILNSCAKIGGFSINTHQY